MSLKIYRTESDVEDFSIDGSYDVPLVMSFDGTAGGYLEVKYFIRNDDLLNYYTAITIQPIDGGDNIVNNGTYSWKLKASVAQPLQIEWDAVTAGASAAIADIGSAGGGDTSTYLPVWLRAEIPAGVDVQSFEAVTLRLNYTETLV